MAKKISEDEFQKILKAVQLFPDGASSRQIDASLNGEYPPRTLRRHLARLAQSGRLIVNGQGRATRYHIPSKSYEIETPRTVLEDAEIAISPEAESIRQAVREPVQNRKPIGYNRDFLDAYQPNQTYYLSADIREHLQEIGRTPEEDRPAGTYARQILDRLLIDLSWNSSRLEGNTYSLLETEVLLAQGEGAEGKDAKDAQMILNHKAAIEFIVDPTAEIGFNRFTILNLHALLSDNLVSDPGSSGRLRRQSVGIAKSVFSPLEVPQLIDEYFQSLLTKAAAIQDPFEQAFFVMIQIPYLQPFIDVNKRVSRLAANLPFIRENLCPLSFLDMPQKIYTEGVLAIYELNRTELLRDIFVWAYERSSSRYSAIRQSLGQPDPFRLRYRNDIAQLIAEIVRQKTNKKSAVAMIRKRAAEDVPEKDVPRFIEVVETELMHLHEGSIACYRIRPSEFTLWRDAWTPISRGEGAT